MLQSLRFFYFLCFDDYEIEFDDYEFDDYEFDFDFDATVCLFFGLFFCLFVLLVCLRLFSFFKFRAQFIP